eukprot:TRINITY_DN915_c0_g1_i1.p1 TRINITY_DN915_c0_g1~~TRINITY_DN915_c0_g1_i1.p1  ORF type:complete len:106 (+),score=4.41 TRINITY_DN915_c0_g1_i1:181-498(+)
MSVPPAEIPPQGITVYLQFTKQTLRIGKDFMVTLGDRVFRGTAIPVSYDYVYVPATDILLEGGRMRIRVLQGGITPLAVSQGLHGQVLLQRNEGRIWENVDAAMW